MNTKAHPYHVVIKLSDWFNLADPKEFPAGTYQINVKFFVTHSLQTPLDSGPIKLEIGEIPTREPGH